MSQVVSRAIRHRCVRPTQISPIADASRSFSTSPRRDVSYGFIGLGRMGYPMAKNLRAQLAKTDKLFVHDVNRDAVNKFIAEVPEGVEAVDTVRQLAENSENIITSLPEPSHVQNVFKSMLEPTTLPREGIADERLFVDCSTIDPRSSREVADAVQSSGQGKFVDAPMSGGVVGAQAGTLTFMVGCKPELLPRVEALLKMMGRRILHLGEQSAGLKGKLANNYLLAINNIATAEAMNMGVKWGLDPQKLAGMINTSTGKCWPSEVNNPVPGVVENAPASRDYEGGFGVSLQNKDLRLALKAANEEGAIVLLGHHARGIYDLVEADENCKGRDFSVVYKYLCNLGSA